MGIYRTHLKIILINKNNMNKKLFSLLAGIVLVVAGFTLASCNNDDNKNISSQTVSFECEANDVLLEIAELTVNYTDANGNTQSERLTGYFSKTITVSKFPAQGAFKVKATLKSSFDTDKVIGKTPSLTYTYTCGVTKKPGIISQMFVYTKDDLNELIEKINSNTWKWNILASGTIITD